MYLDGLSILIIVVGCLFLGVLVNEMAAKYFKSRDKKPFKEDIHG